MFDNYSGGNAYDEVPSSVFGASWEPPGQVLRASVGQGSRAVGNAIDAIAEVAPRVDESDLVGGLEDVDRLRARADALTLRLVMEALDRGVPAGKGLNAHDWLARRCPWMAPAAVNDMVTVARGVGDPLHAGLREQVLAMVVSVRRTAAVLRALSRVKAYLGATAGFAVDEGGEQDKSEYEVAAASLMAIAADVSFTDKDLRRVTDRLASTVLPEKEHAAREKAASELRGVNESSLADGSLIRFIFSAEAEGAALLRALFASPLAAPCPDETGDDPRTATQRRYDALVATLKRALAGGDSVPTTAKASVNVTVSYEALVRALTGTGVTDTGDALSPETVRRLSCDADIIPMVLGTQREIVNQGRAKRLVTPGQRRALHHRDKGCTFPECTVPASWTDAHHVVHWSRNGPSDLSNYALLCGRHHTLVHERDLMATVKCTGVTWHV